MRLEMGEARPKRLKKIRKTALRNRVRKPSKPSNHHRCNAAVDCHSRGTESEDAVDLGDLGLGLNVTEDGVLGELGVKRGELALDGLVGLLDVGVVDKVLGNLLSLGSGHLYEDEKAWSAE
jgi:hypothetical protein